MMGFATGEHLIGHTRQGSVFLGKSFLDRVRAYRTEFD